MPLNLGGLTISSGAFAHGEPIPDRHAREHEDLAPALSWEGVPDDTEELVLVCHDPDAPLVRGFTHWVVYGIPPEVSGIPEGDGASHTQGRTSFGDEAWGGPLPPEGHGDHHYYFHLYALREGLDAGPGLTREQVLERLADTVIEQARVVGTYSR